MSYNELLVLEKNGITQQQIVVNNEIVRIDITGLLNGVDLERTKVKMEKRPEMEDQTVRLFYSYSHKDETLRSELETHLKILQRQGLISSWHDRQITAGDEWKDEIDKNLDSADIVLLLISADFIASDYAWEKEMTRALERRDNAEAVVIPVILRDANWKKAPFGKLQALPENVEPVTKWTDKDSAWRNVSEGIEKAAEKILAEKSRRNV